MLYCLHSGVLADRSEIFARILPMAGTGGNHEDDPVFLEGMLSQEFDYVVSFMLSGCVEHTFERV